MTLRKYDPATIDAALADAYDIGLGPAARKHGINYRSLLSHKKRRGLAIPRRRSGYMGARKPIDGDLEALRALFPPYITFTSREIAEIVGDISFQRLHQIEQKALRKIRHALIDEGAMREAS